MSLSSKAALSQAAARTVLPAVAVVEEDAVVLTQLVRFLVSDFDVSPFCTLDEVLDAGLVGGPGVVLVLGPSEGQEEVLDRVGALARAERGVASVLVVDEADAALMRLALRSGIDDAVSFEQAGSDLVAAVEELRRVVANEVAARSAPPDATAAEGPRRGRIITVFSPKGGVGKSVVSVNLAASLARREGSRVVLVDADLQFGDIAVMLRLAPVHNIVEAAQAGGRLDSSFLESLLVRHESSGVSVLASPTDPSSGEKVTAGSITAILDVLRGIATDIVVDTPPLLDDVVLQLLAESDEIVFLVGMDVPSLKNARLGIQAFEVLQLPLERVLVVLNRANSKVYLSSRDVEKTLQMKVDAALPSDALVPQSVNKGVPAVMEFDRSKFAASVHDLARLVIERSAQEAEG
ncbi:MAG TPA: AAA family ATPase [Acidimicrobiales bacterium]|nr:AAA family ATPase [Acidimicrobiales bacterium]